LALQKKGIIERLEQQKINAAFLLIASLEKGSRKSVIVKKNGLCFAKRLLRTTNNKGDLSNYYLEVVCEKEGF